MTMGSIRRLFSVLTVAALLAAAPQAQAAPAPESFAEVVQGLSPAVVNIATSQSVKTPPPLQFQMPDVPPGHPLEQFKEFFDQFQGQPGMGGPGGGGRKLTSLGSGFIVDPDGYVVTNNHVIAEADEITVTLNDNTELKAEIIGHDPSTDIALLKVKTNRKLPYVKFGDSDKVRVGDWVLAIGNPFGLGGTVTAGIISARGRDIYAGPFDDFLQTDAAINRGNSGGPMFNLQGEVVGVNTAIFSPSGGNIGIGFAVPSALAKPVVEQLKELGRIRRGWLGVKIQTVTDEIADSVGLKSDKGALVVEVTKGSPADKAGIRSGDVILSFDGREIEVMRRLPRMVAETPIGKTVKVVLWREGARKEVALVTGELPDSRAESRQSRTPAKEPGAAGESILGLTLKRDGGQVTVAAIDPASPASERGVRVGDRVLKVGDEDIGSPDDVRKAIAVSEKAGRKFILWKLGRGEDVLFVTIPLK